MIIEKIHKGTIEHTMHYVRGTRTAPRDCLPFSFSYNKKNEFDFAIAIAEYGTALPS